MLRTSLAVLALTLLAGAAQATPVPALSGSNLVITVADDATSENDAIQLDENTEPSSPGSAMEKAPSTLPDPGEAKEMEESDVINE